MTIAYFLREPSRLILLVNPYLRGLVVLFLPLGSRAARGVPPLSPARTYPAIRRRRCAAHVARAAHTSEEAAPLKLPPPLFTHGRGGLRETKGRSPAPKDAA